MLFVTFSPNIYRQLGYLQEKQQYYEFIATNVKDKRDLVAILTSTMELFFLFLLITPQETYFLSDSFMISPWKPLYHGNSRGAAALLSLYQIKLYDSQVMIATQQIRFKKLSPLNKKKKLLT